MLLVSKLKESIFVVLSPSAFEVARGFFFCFFLPEIQAYAGSQSEARLYLAPVCVCAAKWVISLRLILSGSVSRLNLSPVYHFLLPFFFSFFLTNHTSLLHLRL